MSVLLPRQITYIAGNLGVEARGYDKMIRFVVIWLGENDLFPPAMAFVAPDAPRVAISIAGVEANCTVQGD